MRKNRLISNIIFFLLALFTRANNALIGVWQWENKQDPRDIKVLFKADSIAIYKISNTEPIVAKWELIGNELIVSSDDFTWDYVYKQLISPKYHKMADYTTEEHFKKGKILDIKGNVEKYRYDDVNMKILPIQNNTLGVLTKTNLSEQEFNEYIPFRCIAGGGQNYYQDSELEIIHTTTSYEREDDTLLSTAAKLASKVMNASPCQYDYLLEKLPEKIDSIEFKFIDLCVVHDDYFAIERKAFDKTFDYIKQTGNSNHRLIDVVTSDSCLISYIAKLFLRLRPYPMEAIKITPYNVWRNSKDFNLSNYGIIHAEGIDPIETRGKIVLFAKEETIVCYCSLFSIDYKNHRYEICPELYYLLFYFGLMY